MATPGYIYAPPGPQNAIPGMPNWVARWQGGLGTAQFPGSADGLLLEIYYQLYQLNSVFASGTVNLPLIKRQLDGTAGNGAIGTITLAAIPANCYISSIVIAAGSTLSPSDTVAAVDFSLGATNISNGVQPNTQTLNAGLPFSWSPLSTNSGAGQNLVMNVYNENISGPCYWLISYVQLI